MYSLALYFSNELSKELVATCMNIQVLVSLVASKGIMMVNLKQFEETCQKTRQKNRDKLGKFRD